MRVGLLRELSQGDWRELTALEGAPPWGLHHGAPTLEPAPLAERLRAAPEAQRLRLEGEGLLRHLPALWELFSPLALGSREVVLVVGVQELLEQRAEVEQVLSRGLPVRLGLELTELVSFSRAERERAQRFVSDEQLGRALELLRAWTARFGEQLRGLRAREFALFTPWTTLEDLRVNANVLRREGGERLGALRARLRLSPGTPAHRLAEQDGLLLEAGAAPGEGAPWRFRDVRTEQVWQRLGVATEATEAELFELFERALDAAAGVARGKRGRPLRMVRAPRDEPQVRPTTQRLTLNHASHQRCVYCSRHADERLGPRERAARAIQEVRRAAERGVTTLELSGGEPLLEWYLPQLIELARSLGVEQVLLETSATRLAEQGGASALAAAGLTHARVSLSALDPVVSDALTRDPGGHARTLRGVRELLEAGVTVELAFCLTPLNQGELVALVRALGALFPAAARPLDVVVRHAEPSGAAPALAAPLAAAELTQAAAAAREVGVRLRSAPRGELPPCAFEAPAELGELLRLGEVLVARDGKDYARLPSCASCAALAVCPGARPSLAAELSATARPLGESLTRGALLPITEQRARVLAEYSSRFFVRGPSGRVVERRVFRLNFHCNQACDFCFVSRELPPVEHELLVREIEEAARAGAVIELSGGEPTLNPRVTEYIALAQRLGAPQVVLQTNAIKMAELRFARELATAGLREAFVSLHGVSPEVSDRVTAAPGTFVRTVAGVQHLVSLGVDVCLNFVLCGYNIEDLGELPDFVHRVIVPHAREAKVQLNFSFVAASTDNVPRDTRLIPRFTAVAASLERAHERASALGLGFTGFDSKCGVPACYLPWAIREAHFAADLPEEELRRHGEGFTKSPACARCELQRRCYGVRTTYAELYGTGELRPIIGGRVTEQEEVERPQGPPWASLGLSATAHRLRPGSAAALLDDRAFQRAPSAWLDGLPRVDKEQVQLLAGLRQVIKIERATASRAEETAAQWRQLGLESQSFLGAPGPGGAPPRAIVFVGQRRAAVEEAVALEGEITRSRAERAPFVRRMGELLGYPGCCVERFVESADQDDATHIQRLAQAHQGRLAPEQNWTAVPLRPFSHFPCEPSCAATAALGRATLLAIERQDARYAAKLRQALRSVALVRTATCFALLLEAREDGAEAYTYRAVLSHRTLGVEDAVLGRPEFRAFFLEIVAPLAEGDHVQRLPGSLRITRGGRHLTNLHFDPAAPALLDFTAG